MFGTDLLVLSAPSSFARGQIKHFVSGAPGREPDTKFCEEHTMSTAGTLSTAGTKGTAGTMSTGFTPSRNGAPPRLRMTKRGRFVLTAVVAGPLVVVAMLFGLNGGQASASLEGSDDAFQYVTVASGESLWQVAGELAPTADPRDVIDQIVRLNQLSSSDVFAGQQLAIPAQYAE